MAQLRRRPSTFARSEKAARLSGGERKHELSQGEKVLLRRIGLKIHKDLHDQGRPVEWLAFNVGVARSSIREIIAGRSNPRLLTLTSIAKGLGYRNLVDFLISI